jgi:hypothetical protein
LYLFWGGPDGLFWLLLVTSYVGLVCWFRVLNFVGSSGEVGLVAGSLL